MLCCVLGAKGGTACEGDTCFPVVAVKLFPNGGPFNSTDLPPVEVSVKRSDDEEGLWQIQEHAGSVFFEKSARAQQSMPVEVYTETGEKLNNTSTLLEGQMLFLRPLLPLFHHEKASGDMLEPFVWPGIAVGHRKAMHGVTGANGEVCMANLRPAKF